MGAGSQAGRRGRVARIRGVFTTVEQLRWPLARSLAGRLDDRLDDSVARRGRYSGGHLSLAH